MSRVAALTVALLGLCVMPLLAAAQGSTAKPSTAKPGTAKPSTAKPASAPTGPVLEVDTMKGTFEIELFPEDAPKSVDHIIRLVKRNFYNGQRVHRVVPGGLIQFGDPLSRDMSKRDSWGMGSLGSGKTIGAAEFSKKRLHVAGSVGLAHAGDAKEADSQMYIIMVPRPQYDGSYAVIGRVIKGLDIVAKIEEADRIKKISVREPAPKS